MALNLLRSWGMTNEHVPDYDSPWKEALELYFEDFLAFFFPEAHVDIHWGAGHHFLDKELQQVARDADTGRRLVDKLVRVRRNSGEEAWVLVHVEVQGQADSSFAERMYVYNYRLFDRYHRKVASLAVLADGSPNWRPHQYGYDLWGCRAALRFPVAKLLDYADRWPALEASDNPFAVVVMAHLKAMETRDDPRGRFHSKLSLVRRLYERGYAKRDIMELLRFIDWVMVLPGELEHQLDKEVARYEEERRMRYVTSWERSGFKRGMEKGSLLGLREAVRDILCARFTSVPRHITELIEQTDDTTLLRALVKQAAVVGAVEDLVQTVERNPTT